MTSADVVIRIAALPDGGLEAVGLRAILEASGRRTDLRFLATPHQLLELLGEGSDAPRLFILCGHGRNGALYIGELGPGLGGELLSDGFLPPETLRGRISLPGTTVLCTACNSGHAELGAHFIAGGASAFVGPEDEPDGDDMMLAAHILLHGLCRGLSKRAAVEAAMTAVDGRMKLRLHQVAPETDVSHAAQR